MACHLLEALVLLPLVCITLLTRVVSVGTQDQDGSQGRYKQRNCMAKTQGWMTSVGPMDICFKCGPFIKYDGVTIVACLKKQQQKKKTGIFCAEEKQSPALWPVSLFCAEEKQSPALRPVSLFCAEEKQSPALWPVSLFCAEEKQSPALWPVSLFCAEEKQSPALWPVSSITPTRVSP